MTAKSRFYEGLKKTANIIAVTILLVVSAVTFDFVLLAIGVVAEALYLVGYIFWPSLDSRYATVLQSRAHPDSASSEFLSPRPRSRFTRYLLLPPSRSRVTFLDGVLLVVTVIGFVVIFFFGFGKHLLSHPLPSLTHAEGWDTGAIIWTGFFLFYYTLKFSFTKKPILDKAIIFTITWLSLPFLTLAWLFMGKPIIHVLFIWLIGVCFFVIDLLIWKKHPDPIEKDLSKTSLLWADVPMVVAFAVLMGYLLWHRDTENKDVFVSGVVSCQLLISNAVFVVMEFGLLKTANTAVVSGVVQDKNDKGIRGAVLNLTLVDKSLSQRTSTDDSGRFQFLNLPVGSCEITVEAQGFAKLSKEVILVVGVVDNLRLVLTALS